MRVTAAWLVLLLEMVSGLAVRAQIDPSPRELFQFGYNQPLEGRGPLGAYAFYYLNIPGFLRTNQTLRLAVAPVYLDSELGFSGLLGEDTDFALGLSGGGFADSYSEVRQGKLWREESFDGHNAELTASVYRLFNPGRQIPLNGVLQGGAKYSIYDGTDRTAAGFILPRDHTTGIVRTGLRWGGVEPIITPEVGLELSIWYEGQFRTSAGTYGYADDRAVHPASHQFWSRGLFTYTLPDIDQRISVSLTLGTSVNADRLSAYRLGAFLPLISEFPLSIPGYYYQELSAKRFVLLSGSYDFPLDDQRRWKLMLLGSIAGVDYLDGLSQSGRTHSGIGGALSYQSPKDMFRIIASYSYGFDAIRSDGRGARNIALLCEIDLEPRKGARDFQLDPRSPYKSRGLLKLFRN